jgi:hypothetical protein
MLLRIALLLFFLAFVLSLIAKNEGRTWMIRLGIAGFCALLAWAFIRVLARVL